MPETEGRHWDTSDFSIASYLFSRGVKLERYELLPNSRRQFKFIFLDEFENVKTGERIPCDSLEIDYINSESYQFDSAQRALKKLCLGRR